MSQEWKHPKGDDGSCASPDTSDDVSSETKNRPVKRANLQSVFRGETLDVNDSEGFGPTQ